MNRTVLFDASRLLSRSERAAPTGVDRVCLAYAEWLLGRPDVVVRPVKARQNQLVAVDPDWFARCVADLRTRWSGDFFDRPLTSLETRLLAALNSPGIPAESVLSPPPDPGARKAPDRTPGWRQILRTRRLGPSPRGDLYFNVGHTTLGDAAILSRLRAQGTECVVMIHDLIPITHPEFCRPGDGDKHRQRVRTALRHASRILVNSRYTGDELTAFAAREGLPIPPVDVAHLGLEPIFLTPGPAAPPVRDRPPYFVHVGTIEARKNLAFLLTIWRRLHEQMGADTPRLVLIGRYGWENEAVLDHLERSPNLRGVVHQAANLPDAVLADLMRGAHAVLAPSSVEGFDLPAVEALALGVPLIASDIPAHRELAPEARLVDPLDGLGWLQAIAEAARRRPEPVQDAATPDWPRHFARVAASIGLAPLSES